MKLIDKLGTAFIITTLSLMAVLVWFGWYVIDLGVSPNWLQWAFGLIPLVDFAVIFTLLPKDKNKNEH